MSYRAGRSYVRGRGKYTVYRPRKRRRYSRAPRPSYRPRVRGRGAYKVSGGGAKKKAGWSAVKLGGTLGGAIGGTIGSYVAPGIGTAIGSGLGSALGSGAGQLFKSITGFGDYTVHENALLGKSTAVPSFGEDSIRVRKCEYVCDINATEDFSNNYFPVNPGLDETFPWLSRIAANYEQYRWNGLIFMFKSTSSDAIASTTDLGLGQVVLASDYNSADPPFVNQPQMLGTMFSNSGKPSNDIYHAVECATRDMAQKLFYVRTGDVPTGADIRLYDMLSFQLATQNMPAQYTGMGQLWVSYDISFTKSVMNNQLGFAVNQDLFLLTGTASASPLGTDFEPENGSNLGGSIDGGHYYFPPQLASGYYQVQCTWQRSSPGTWAIVSLTGTNCTILPDLITDGDGFIGNMAESTLTACLTFWIRIDSRNAVVNFNNLNLSSAGSLLRAWICVTQINGELILKLQD